jgi:DNA-binding transcriptional LysR family regulator
MEFPVSSDECRLLLLLESTGSVKQTAQALQRDISVVSRQIAQLADRHPLVEKVGGKWQVSAAGKRLNVWARDAVIEQQQAIHSRTGVKIATTREFAARVLAPKLAELMALWPEALITLRVSEEGVERLILDGEVDLAFECGRPRDPGVRFQRVTPEAFVVVLSPRLVRRRPLRSVEELLALPHLQYSRYSASRALRLAADQLRPVAVLNDLASIRAAAVAGLGWGVLPHYAVEAELKEGTLIKLDFPGLPEIEPEQFGVWWLRDRKGLESWARQATQWLGSQRL